ncbi:hypothetical protein M885DRAFT_572759 [Pelagophyceae sp. CCMP2097]|nr:hypothetical protein M885DRAFT_572759 [Pelagophyceae sp. CCMP2097]
MRRQRRRRRFAFQAPPAALRASFNASGHAFIYGALTLIIAKDPDVFTPYTFSDETDVSFGFARSPGSASNERTDQVLCGLSAVELGGAIASVGIFDSCEKTTLHLIFNGDLEVDSAYDDSITSDGTVEPHSFEALAQTLAAVFAGHRVLPYTVGTTTTAAALAARLRNLFKQLELMRLRARAAGEPAIASVDAAAAIVASRVDHATSLVAAQASGVPAPGSSRDDGRTALQESTQDNVVVLTLKALQGSQAASGTTQAIIPQIELGYTHTGGLSLLSPLVLLQAFRVLSSGKQTSQLLWHSVFMLVYRDIMRHCKHITRTEDLAFAFGIDITENMVRTLGNLRVGETWTIERIQSVMSIFACIECRCLAGIYDGIAAFVNMLLLEGSVDVSAIDVNLAGTAMTKAIVERASICAQAPSQDRPIPHTGMISQAGIMDFKARAAMSSLVPADVQGRGGLGAASLARPLRSGMRDSFDRVRGDSDVRARGDGGNGAKRRKTIFPGDRAPGGASQALVAANADTCKDFNNKGCKRTNCIFRHAAV